MNPGVAVESLPRVIYLFPVEQLLLLPKTSLGFGVNGRWHCDLLDQAEQAGGFLGVVQPREADRGAAGSGAPRFYQVGCLGRLRSIDRDEETYRVQLTGLIRFRIVQERLTGTEPQFPLAEVEYDEYQADLEDREEQVEELDLAGFKAGLLQAIAQLNPKLDTRGVQAMSGHEVLRSLIQVVRLSAAEKQTILEAKGLKEMAGAFFLLLAMNFLSSTQDPAAPDRVH